MPSAILSSSALSELRELVQVEECGGDVQAFADLRLRPTGEKYQFSERHVQIYSELRNRGFISAVKLANGLVRVALTQAGIDYIHDLDAQERLRAEQARIAEEMRIAEKEADRKIQFRHDYRVAVVAAIVSYVLGLLTGLSGVLQAMWQALTQSPPQV